MSTEYTIAKEVDSRGLNCPLPILKAKRALADMQSGDVLKVLSTDPGSVDQQTVDKEFIHLMRRR